MTNELLKQYRAKFLKEMDTDENADYRRGFYAGCVFAILETKEAQKNNEKKIS